MWPTTDEGVPARDGCTAEYSEERRIGCWSPRWALVSDTDQVGCRQLSLVAAAVQKQAMRDFEPL